MTEQMRIKEKGTGPFKIVSVSRAMPFNAAEGEAELMRFEAPQGFDVEVQARFASYVAFDQSGPGQGRAVSPTLQQLTDFVEDTVALFERFFQKTTE
jgi:hypothetical protein